jgi:hypothetical protein
MGAALLSGQMVRVPLGCPGRELRLPRGRLLLPCRGWVVDAIGGGHALG